MLEKGKDVYTRRLQQDISNPQQLFPLSPVALAGFVGALPDASFWCPFRQSRLQRNSVPFFTRNSQESMHRSAIQENPEVK
jgi:hypothetical protein